MLLAEAVGIGMLLSLALTEIVGLAAGRIVWPGYIALVLNDPIQVISTIIAGLVTYLIIKGLSRYIVVYGRRLLILCILIGYIIAYLTRIAPVITFNKTFFNIETIGFVIPGLIAYWIDRQGIIPKIFALFFVSS